MKEYRAVLAGGAKPGAPIIFAPQFKLGKSAMVPKYSKSLYAGIVRMYVGALNVAKSILETTKAWAFGDARSSIGSHR